MTVKLQNSPFPITFRELWMPKSINGTSLPSAINGGHPLTLTGAAKRTTADGVHFTGAATSNIVVTAAAGQNAKAAFHVTIRFKLDQTFAAGAAGNFYFLNKVNAATYIRAYLKAADGKFYWEQDNGAGGAGFSLTSTTVSWTAGTWYIVTVSLTDTPTQRLLVNGILEDSDTSAAVATPNGGDMIVGSSSDGGTDGVAGTVSWVVIGVGATATVALTTAEETDLSKGIPPVTAKVIYQYLLDEGRGTTAYDTGSAGGNGTLDSACTWAFGQVREPVLSLDGVSDYAASSSGVSIKEPCSLVVVTKVKSTFDTSLADSIIALLRVGANDYLKLYHNNGADGVEFIASGGGTAQTLSDTVEQVIDDYRIYIATLTSGGVATLYRNGTQVATASGVGAVSAAAAIAYIGATNTPDTYGNDKVLKAILVDTAFTASQVKAYSRYLRDCFNLPISI